MIEPHVVGDEVEHELAGRASEAARAAGPGPRRPPRSVMHRVAGDGEPGAGDVLLAQVGQRLLETPCATRGWCARPAAPAGPVCQTLSNQTQSKPISARRSSSASGMSSSVAGRPSVAGQLRQPDAGVDLVQRRIARRCHGRLVSRSAEALHRQVQLDAADAARDVVGIVTSRDRARSARSPAAQAVEGRSAGLALPSSKYASSAFEAVPASWSRTGA